MKNQSGTYRLFSLLMGILVAISITIPADAIAAHCDMDKEHPAAEMSADHCPMASTHQHEESHDQHEKCDSLLSCACDITFTKIDEAVPTLNKTAKAFVVSVIHYLDDGQISRPTFTVDVEFSLNTHFPPIFLLNSVFLN